MYVHMYIHKYACIQYLCIYVYMYSTNKMCKKEAHGADFLLYVPAFSHLQNLQ